VKRLPLHGFFEDRSALAAFLGVRGPQRRSGPVVLANGCFDLLHVGHLRYLADAKSRGRTLVVAVNSDASVRAIKGPNRPLTPFAERVEILCALDVVDFVVPFREPTLEATLRVLLPDVHAKGTDYTPDSIPERAIDLELGIEIAICGDPKDRSSTQLIQALGQDAI